MESAAGIFGYCGEAAEGVFLLLCFAVCRIGNGELAADWGVEGFREVWGDGFDHAAGTVKAGLGEVGSGGGAHERMH